MGDSAQDAKVIALFQGPDVRALPLNQEHVAHAKRHQADLSDSRVPGALDPEHLEPVALTESIALERPSGQRRVAEHYALRKRDVLGLERRIRELHVRLDVDA